MSRIDSAEYPTAAHRRQYETTDFVRHTDNHDLGFNGGERYYISRYFDPHRPTMEVGTGGGRVAFALEAKGFTDVTAVDFVEGFIARAREIAKKKGSAVVFRQADVVALPFGDRAFTQILCLGVVISHLPSRELRRRALAELYRVLEPNGILILDSMNALSGHELRWIGRLMSALRWLHNPFNYESNDLPRLGSGGKIDPVFFKTSKPTLHYYYPDELMVDVMRAGLMPVEISCCLSPELVGHSAAEVFHSPNLHIAARRPAAIATAG